MNSDGNDPVAVHGKTISPVDIEEGEIKGPEGARIRSEESS